MRPSPYLLLLSGLLTFAVRASADPAPSADDVPPAYAGVVSDAPSAMTPRKYEWQLDERYDGEHPGDFGRLRYEVPILIRQTLIDIAVATGLDFQEGWNHPLSIRFADTAPPGVENALAYVEFFSDGTNAAQRLSINLAAYAAEPFNFDKVFRHELFHAMLNDALGLNATNIPIWLHEGLAVYAAGQGEQMINSYLSKVETGEEERFVNGLDGPHGGADYVEDYLAIKYIRERHGINSIKAFARELVARKGDVPSAIEASCFEDYAAFQANARDFAVSELVRIKRTLRGAQAGPF
jgi:hypothetical protein